MNANLRDHERLKFATQGHIICENLLLRMLVNNISVEGICFTTENKLNINTLMHLELSELNEYGIELIACKVEVRQRLEVASGFKYCCRIVESDRNWSVLLAKVENRINGASKKSLLSYLSQTMAA
ncbi:hypothetical protein THMIRHAS_03390 [Thiosulfatimonas sediminis]|uniref:PilZ domain-containing protein n=1 Tax=Thiosulfatimonas sediminis TaxID=2675054 RepID=A0A6F8PSA4_9GAMM|nr:PilZ domain-containing protein [Thiosulfatimonas sediminis]BBP44966.1 hypothetical protein THMIRHAS_03390 [Thiosulfatimonas sediminis]